MSISKKEKGTTNSTQDSVKNHLQYSKIYNQNKRTVIALLENLEKQLAKKFNHLTDHYLIQDNKKTIEEIKHIRKVAENDPRYPWWIIQKKIDATFQADKNITGVRIVIKFEDLKPKNINNFNPQIYGF